MPSAADQYDPIIQAASAEWDIDPTALKALIIHESGGRADAVGRSGERGLTQLMPGTAVHLGLTDIRSPEQQIYGGAKYLAEALAAERDDPYKALRYYNGGPGWRTAGGNPAYPSYVAGEYQKLLKAQPASVKLAQADTGTATDATPAPADSTPARGANVAQAASKDQPGDDPFTRALNAPGKPAQGDGEPGGAAEPDAFTKALGKPAAADTEQPGETTARGVARNVAAGALEGAGGAINVITNPSGNLIGKPLATGIIFAHDVLAPVFGYQRFSDADRNALLGDTVPQVGSRIATAAGADTVTPQSRTEELIRAGTAGAVGAGALGAGAGVGSAGLLAGAGGAVTGNVAAANVPTWAAPAAELAGNVLGGAAAVAAGKGLASGVRSAASGPVPEHPLAPRAPAQTVPDPMAARVAEVTGRPAPGAPEPAPPPTPEQPGAAGAQWSGANGARIVGITPAEEAAYRVNAEGQKLIEPQPVGIPDRRALVEGVNPNLAEQEQSVNTARELKNLQIRSTDASQQAKEIAGEHNQARTNYMNNTTGAETDILRRTAQRQADIEQAKPIVFAPENVTGPVDHAPIVAKIDDILNLPENRQNDAVQKVIRPLIDRMVNEDGTAKITDPREWWGMRQQIDRWTSKRMDADDPNLHYAAHDLNEIAKVIDQQIEKVAPGYDAMIAKYAEHSRAIGAMRVLQDEAKKVYVSGGGTMRMTFEGVQRMMKHIVDMRNADPTDLNPYKQIGPETMDKLWALRDDLRRSASAIELAKTPGSDTAQNLWDMIRGLASGPEAQHAFHAFAATHLGMPGYVAARAGTAAIGALRAGRQTARDTARAAEILRPPPNLLQYPPAP